MAHIEKKDTHTPCHVPLSTNVLKGFIEKCEETGRDYFPLLDARIPVPKLEALLDQYDAKKHPFVIITGEKPSGLILRIGEDVHTLEAEYE